MTDLKYEILIPTIPHRHDELCRLLWEIDGQIQPGVGVRVFRDNLESRYCKKNSTLMYSSKAEYISWLDDDDWIAPDYVSKVMTAIQESPDYVGYPILWTIDGKIQMPIEHSLRYDGWYTLPDRLVRDISSKNPIRRELALLGSWDYLEHGCDGHWAYTVRNTGKCTKEAWIPDPIYHYRFSTSNSFLTPRKPMDIKDIPPLPSYPWMVSI